jgi:SOS response regulatory protein OraA/RecX
MILLHSTMSKVIFQKMGYELKSEQSLMNLAEFYCSKRETSRAWLGKYLQRKCREQNIEQSVYREWIESVLNACEESKMVNDKRYAEILIRELTRRGKGIRYIEQKLKQKGIPKDLREIPEDEEGEFLRALTLAKKNQQWFEIQS